MSTIPNVKNRRAQETCRIFFFLLSIYFTINYYLCSHYASPLHITTTYCHYALPLRITTTYRHYALPLRIAATTVTSHIGKKRPKTRNMTILKGFVIHTFHGNNDQCKAVYDVCVVQPLSEFLFFIFCLILLIY